MRMFGFIYGQANNNYFSPQSSCSMILDIFNPHFTIPPISISPHDKSTQGHAGSSSGLFTSQRIKEPNTPYGCITWAGRVGGSETTKRSTHYSRCHANVSQPLSPLINQEASLSTSNSEASPCQLHPHTILIARPIHADTQTASPTSLTTSTLSHLHLLSTHEPQQPYPSS